jgi:uncharacterized protein YpiB (UPF0302 family)
MPDSDSTKSKLLQTIDSILALQQKTLNLTKKLLPKMNSALESRDYEKFDQLLEKTNNALASFDELSKTFDELEEEILAKTSENPNS